MKKLILFAVIILNVNFSFADCSSSGMQFFPMNKNISLNPMFIIEGYAYSQQTVESFKNRNVYLIDENGEKINLKLIEIIKGQMSLTQAVFKVESQLKPKTKYFIRYTNETVSEISERKKYNSNINKSEEIFWETNENENTELLNPNLKLKFDKTNVIHYGCGPSANAIFEVSNSSKSETWFKTEVLEISTNTTTTFYLTSYENKINVGHGMCSGAFTFKNNGKYKVRFTAMNTDGKELESTEWTTFESPFKNDKFGR